MVYRREGNDEIKKNMEKYGVRMYPKENTHCGSAFFQDINVRNCGSTNG